MKKILNYDLPKSYEIDNVLVLEENDDKEYPVWVSIKNADFEECERPENILMEMNRAEENKRMLLLSIDDLRDMANNMLLFADLLEKTTSSNRRVY